MKISTSKCLLKLTFLEFSDCLLSSGSSKFVKSLKMLTVIKSFPSKFFAVLKDIYFQH